jgi:hypothetical protein
VLRSLSRESSALGVSITMRLLCGCAVLGDGAVPTMPARSGRVRFFPNGHAFEIEAIGRLLTMCLFAASPNEELRDVQPCRFEKAAIEIRRPAFRMVKQLHRSISRGWLIAWMAIPP